MIVATTYDGRVISPPPCKEQLLKLHDYNINIHYIDTMASLSVVREDL